MLDYLRNNLGEHIYKKKLKNNNNLPSYLVNSYDYSLLDIFKVNCLFVKPKAFNLNTFEKHKEKLSSYYDYQIVLQLENITPYQRKALIKDKIPFVVDNNQIFLPFLGIVLRESFKNPIIRRDKFSPVTQLVFIYWFYNLVDIKVTATDIAKTMNIPVMSANRAFTDLVNTGFFRYEITGKKKILKLVCKKDELLKKIETYLRNPVERRVYVLNKSAVKNPIYSGIYALGEKTLLSVNSDDLTLAINKRNISNIKTHDIVDDNYMKTMGAITVELWSYDPSKLSDSGFVDDISLILSLGKNTDERVQGELLKLKERYSW